MLDLELVQGDRAPDFDGTAGHARRARLRDPLGEVGEADLGAVGEDRGAFDGVAQLAKVARPGMTLQGRRAPRA